jgi:hypothetical protein
MSGEIIVKNRATVYTFRSDLDIARKAKQSGTGRPGIMAAGKVLDAQYVSILIRVLTISYRFLIK